ncbi:MAG: HAD-IA family hydrolase [Sphaerochaetaceae bacterium]|nr:HAD-IA family hydrolase [Sphaerochaetaceae bacterium]NLY07367.1 HAD-IA family hydrolase [Spirochaetales bacterium]
MICGILFDIDGVIVDSESFLAEACRIWFEKHGCHVTPEDFLPYVGAGENRYIGCVAEKYGLKIDIESAKLEVYRIFEQVADGKTGFGKMPPMPGIVRFVSMARKAGLKLALASSADRMKVEINLRSAGFVPKDFDFVICGSQLKRKKPFGDIYTFSALNLGLSPDECIVVEDAVNGVMAARAAGSESIAVLGSFEEEALRAGGATIVLNNLEGFAEFDSVQSFNKEIDRLLSTQVESLFKQSFRDLPNGFKAAVVSSSAVYFGQEVPLEGETLSPIVSAVASGVASEGSKLKVRALVMESPDRLSLLRIRRYCGLDTRIFILEPDLSLSYFGWNV